MRKITIILLSIFMGILMMTGCKKEEEQDKVVTVNEDQFALPHKGDTVAEIIVRDYGSIYVKFFEEAAPKAVENFTTHAKEGYYDGLTFHRIIENFMIQGGDPTGTGGGGESIWGGSFEDEFASNLQPYRGSLCMANAGPDTNGSQFFLVQCKDTYDKDMMDQIEVRYNVKFDEESRKYYGETGGTPWLYKMHSVFGQIYEGLEVLDEVAAVEKLDERNGIPATEIIIDSIKVFDYE